MDVSALPFLLPDHPMSTVHMLAEKIAQNIVDGDRAEEVLEDEVCIQR